MAIRRLFFFAILSSCVIVTVPMYWPGVAPEVAPDALMNFIGDGEAPAILDVRTLSEFEAGHIPFAINASVFSLFSEHENLAISQQETLILYCKSGIRAQLAVLIMWVAGYESVYILDGHLEQWKNEGYPLILA